jgi:hypothetical protein
MGTRSFFIDLNLGHRSLDGRSICRFLEYECPLPISSVEILFLGLDENVFLTRNVRGNILQRYPDADTSLSVSIGSDRNRRRDLCREKAVRLFRNRGKAARKWRMRALFVDLHKTRITIWTPPGKHLPPWIFKRSTPCEKASNHS